jgi:diacylglycerol O-acyltransferase / wax synthase
LRLSNPRWLLDPNFDLSYHVRWIAAPGDGSLDGVLEFARQSTMSGLDRERPLWTITVVEGLKGRQAALILTVNHVMSDATGLLAIFGLLGDVTRKPRDLGPMPAIPEPEDESRLVLAAEAASYTGRRILGFLAQSAGSMARTLPTVVRHPRDTATSVAQNVRAVARIAAPNLKTLSPLMTDRRGWLRFAALEADLQGLRKAAKARGCTINDAFVTAVAHAFALYHQRHGKPIDRLRTTIPVDIRKPGDAPFGNRVNGCRTSIPIGTYDPDVAMVTFHSLIEGLKQDAKRPLATTIGTVVNAFGPAVNLVFGLMMKHDDFVISNVKAGDFAFYLAGAKVLSIIPFGPLVGTAANITLVGYHHKALVGVAVDAAAVQDLDSLVACIREGLDAVIALGDEGQV